MAFFFTGELTITVGLGGSHPWLLKAFLDFMAEGANANFHVWVRLDAWCTEHGDGDADGETRLADGNSRLTTSDDTFLRLFLPEFWPSKSYP